MTVSRVRSILQSNTPLLIIFLMGFCLRLYRLGRPSLWYDETVSAYLAHQPLADLIAHTARDIHPPGYYALLHVWAQLGGHSEFSLAFFSVIFGMGLIALAYQVARTLTHRTIAIGAALLVAFSPYNIWYSQEVRMYTLGAFSGLAAFYFVTKALRCTSASTGFTLKTMLYWLAYSLFAALGLYTLYYAAFLLIALNLIWLGYMLWPSIKQRSLLALMVANGLAVILYLPWLPLAWRQATNPPVPPWRSEESPGTILIESWSALSLGQSVEPAVVWFVLLLILGLFGTGFYSLRKTPFLPYQRLTPWLLAAYTIGPLLLIYSLSFITPLYHVRYVFLYSPPFYILLAAGLARLACPRLWPALLALFILLGASLYSLYNYHTAPAYQTDDFRRAVAYLQKQWQPGDVLLANAGYTYTAFVYYADIPQLARRRLVPYQTPTETETPILLTTGTVDGRSTLGWGDPEADFYAMSTADTLAALEALSTDYYRLWMLRAYDTVTDPQGVIRAWLAENAIHLEDQVFGGPSNIRIQGYLLNKAPDLQGENIHFADGLSLAGWTLPQQPWQPGQSIPIQLGWMAQSAPAVDYKMSLKLWDENGELAYQGQDTWPVGTHYRATDWTIGQTIYQSVSLTLPETLPPGRYWLNVELYHPDTVQPLARLDGSDPVVTLGPVVVQ